MRFAFFGLGLSSFSPKSHWSGPSLPNVFRRQRDLSWSASDGAESGLEWHHPAHRTFLRLSCQMRLARKYWRFFLCRRSISILHYDSRLHKTTPQHLLYEADALKCQYGDHKKQGWNWQCQYGHVKMSVSYWHFRFIPKTSGNLGVACVNVIRQVGKACGIVHKQLQYYMQKQAGFLHKKSWDVCRNGRATRYIRTGTW